MVCLSSVNMGKPFGRRAWSLVRAGVSSRWFSSEAAVKTTRPVLEQEAHTHTRTLSADYEMVEEVQRGRFGVVRKVRHLETNRLRACKTIQKSEVHPEELSSEVSILHLLKHPNTANLLAVYEDDKEMHIISDLYTGGELFDKIIDEGKFREKDAARCMAHILTAVEYCHESKIVHRDIKPENVLLNTKSEDDKGQFVLVDFGMATMSSPVATKNSVAGTVPYCAPELLDIQKMHGKQADIWSCGVVMCMLLSGRHPFWGDSNSETAALVRAGLSEEEMSYNSWDDVTASGAELVKQMLDLNPEKRPTAGQVLQHEWFVGGAEQRNELSRSVSRLTQFHRHSELKRSVLRLMTSTFPGRNPMRTTLPESTLAHIQQQFDRMDLRSEGLVPIEQVLQMTGKNTTQDLKALQSVNTNGDGYISREEFAAANLGKGDYLNETCLRVAFEEIDMDANGMLDREELTFAMMRYGGLTPADAIAEVDRTLSIGDLTTSKKGISYHEFLDYMKHE